MSSVGVSGAGGVDDHVFDVAGRVAEEVEDLRPIFGVGASEGIVGHPDLMKVGNGGQASELGGIGQSILAKVDSFQGG